MNILFLAHRVPFPPDKGDKIRALWELKALARRHSIDLFCFCDDPADLNRTGELEKYCRTVYVEKLSPWRTRIGALSGLIRGAPFTLGFFNSSSMRARIDSAFRRYSHEVVVAFSSSMAPYADGLPARCIADIVDCDSEKWSEYASISSPLTSWLWSLEARRLGKYEEHLANTLSATTLCTDAEAASLGRRCPRARIYSLAHPVDLEYWDPHKVNIPRDIRKFQPYVVFSGSMDYRPNIDAVCFFVREVLPQVNRALAEVKFVVAGRNPSAEVRALAAHPGVLVTGSVEDIRPYLAGARVAVSPLRLARGVQNKILEALALGVPVLTTSKAAAAFPAQFRSVLDLADSPQEIAASVFEILSRPASKPERLRHAVAQHFGPVVLDAALEEIVCGSARSYVRDNLLHGKCGTAPGGEVDEPCAL